MARTAQGELISLNQVFNLLLRPSHLLSGNIRPVRAGALIAAGRCIDHAAGVTAKEFKVCVAAEVEKWGKVINLVGIKPT